MGQVGLFMHNFFHFDSKTLYPLRGSVVRLGFPLRSCDKGRQC